MLIQLIWLINPQCKTYTYICSRARTHDHHICVYICIICIMYMYIMYMYWLSCKCQYWMLVTQWMITFGLGVSFFSVWQGKWIQGGRGRAAPYPVRCLFNYLAVHYVKCKTQVHYSSTTLYYIVLYCTTCSTIYGM